MQPVTFVKLGGSLLTDKSAPFTARPAVIKQMAQEIAQARDAMDTPLVVGHGSGSFGHVAAQRSGLAEGTEASPIRTALSDIQQAAATLHHHVEQAFRTAGLSVFSYAPSSAFVTDGGTPVSVQAEPLHGALRQGLLPLTYGDVTLDRSEGAAICSTETVFRALIDSLHDAGHPVQRVLWVGTTDGIYDDTGHSIPRLTPESADQGLDAATGSSGIDVTGGMAHRLETAMALARRTVPSLIINGRPAGQVAAALRGDSVAGTRVDPLE